MKNWAHGFLSWYSQFCWKTAGAQGNFFLETKPHWEKGDMKKWTSVSWGKKTTRHHQQDWDFDSFTKPCRNSQVNFFGRTCPKRSTCGLVASAGADQRFVEAHELREDLGPAAKERKMYRSGLHWASQRRSTSVLHGCLLILFFVCRWI